MRQRNKQPVLGKHKHHNEANFSQLLLFSFGVLVLMISDTIDAAPGQ
jgi:hypothetical protein